MITYKKGDIFEAQTDAVINTVNTVGVMGKGIALQFKERFSQNYQAYKKACENHSLNIGDLLITENNSLFFKYIINFPTKKHWRNPSKYEYLELGLENLILKIKELNIKSIAVPPLGAGNGKLDWEKVKIILEKYFSKLPEVEFIVFEPQSLFETRDNIQISSSHLTPTRALLLDSFIHYNNIDKNLNMLVTQKIAYFLQRFGEPLKLNFSKGWYGPYAANLNKVLQAINGSYIVYSAQYDKPSTTIEIIESKIPEINTQYKKLKPEQMQRSELLKKFIIGFETPFSLEILATVDWILREKPDLTPEGIHSEISNWTKRKSELIKLHHVNVAYKHLVDYKEHFIS
ncbi:MAG: macro domain-containing protein [bacterium]